MKHSFERYCKNYQDIENYEAAKKDNFVGWECHHRLETHTPDGERRLVDIAKKELKALGMYYHRPASELIFLIKSEHKVLHNKGKKFSEEHKKKIGVANKGKKLSEETKRKICEAKKNISEETRKKIAEIKKGNTNTKGRRWFNNGKENKYCYECPDGFTPGMLRK